MLKYSPDMFCCINKQGCFVKVSEASKKILGYEPHQMEGKSYTTFLLPEHKEISLAAEATIVKGNPLSAFENSYFAKDGRVIPLRWTAEWNDEEQLIFCSARDATELVKARQQLDESVQRYKALFENNPDVVFLEDNTGLVTDVNQAFCNTFGLDKTDVIGKPASAFLSSEMAGVNLMSFNEALAGSTLRFDIIHQSATHESLTFDAIKFPVIAYEQIIGVQTIAKDITAIVRSFDTITRQSQKLNTIFESITDAFIMLDVNWKIAIINSTAEKILCLDREKHIGTDFREIYPPADFGEFYDQYNYAITTGRSVHFETPYKEMDLWLEVKAFPSKEGLSIYFDDVTEKVRARQELERLSLVASKTDNGVIITDAQGTTEWVNEGFTRMMGYTLDELKGKKPGQVLQGFETDQDTVQVISKKLQLGLPFNAKLLNYTKAGDKKWVSIDITPIRNESGKISQFVALQRDITFRMKAFEKHKQMTQDLYRQNRDLQQFTYIVSHNLRAPVANALGLISMLTKSQKDTDLFDYAFANLKKSVVQMDTVLHDVNRILSIRDKQDVIDTEMVELPAVFNQAYSILQGEILSCGGTVKVEMDKCQKVNTNRSYLYSIFYNLLSNAIKFRSEERKLLIKVKCFKNQDGSTVISFSDNGKGFDTAKAGNDVFKLYKRFHTDATTKGRGIGLFLVKTHVEVMGGKIEVRSHINQGTEFMICIPQTP
ncbi:PAS domain-containing sensor histidine kinase [Pontibacter aydingkolensis]|nr:PAS domain-containing sensor histidine kinase [Pontibacter aydingkolensis]